MVQSQKQTTNPPLCVRIKRQLIELAEWLPIVVFQMLTLF